MSSLAAMSGTCFQSEAGVLEGILRAPTGGAESGSLCQGGPWSLLYTCPSAAWLCFLALRLQVQLQAESRVLVSHRRPGGPGILTRHTSRGERTLNGQSGPSTGHLRMATLVLGRVLGPPLGQLSALVLPDP